MSRCFPFPPPGYEKKIIVDDVDLLTKEKRKEKKHKKDKKDKERKEGKDKKDKEKNKEKHKEKKERKEKHRDKKEKDKDKHKKDKDRNENNREGLDEKRVEGLPDFHNGRKIAENHQRSVDIKDSKFVQDLARRNRNEGGPTGSHIVQSVSITNDDRDSIPRRKAENHIGNFPAENEKNGKKNVGRRINGQEIRINVQGVGGPVDNHISAGHQKGMDASTVPMGKKHVENRVEGKWKNEPKEYDNKAANPGNKDQEKKRKEKDKEKEKEQEKEKVKERYEAIKGQPRLKDSHKNPLQNCKVKPSDISKDGGKTSIGDSNLGKRKEVEKNGYTHDNNIQPHKLPRHVSSPHPGTENGKKLEPWQAPHAVSEKLLQSANGKVSTKDVRLNDFVAPPKPNISLKMPSPTGVRVDENGETSKRPPHPDAQYLSQILSVPKVEELADIENDDQEWLFSGKRPHEERPKLQTAETGSQQVWDKAIQIEDVDLVVLPYVIPY